MGVLLALLLSACREGRGLPEPTSSVYIPPTAAITNTPIPVVTQTEAPQPEITPTPACTNVLTFLSDLTIPDGSVFAPGEELDKQWQLQNDGSCNWDAAYTVQLIAGPDMGAAAEQGLYPARSGTAFAYQIIFTAPEDPGAYRSAWQAYDPARAAFGDPFFIDIVVVEAAPGDE
jgi:hypothetical protein